MNKTIDYESIVNHYENCLVQYGDTHKGVDWPHPEDAATRYAIMLDLIGFDRLATKGAAVSLLDFGCGAGHLLEYIRLHQKTGIEYSGLDMSAKFVELCKKKFPDQPFYCGDILSSDLHLPMQDYIVMNGVFTEKRELSFEEMFAYLNQMLIKLFPLVNRGIAFNLMSKAVDWERSDLFHVPLDMLQTFLVKNISRHFIVRNDYRLYEYSVYVYK